MVVTEDCLTAGVSAEISARIMEEAFDFLEEPVLRLSGEDIPIPVSPELEKVLDNPGWLLIYQLLQIQYLSYLRLMVDLLIDDL